MKHALLVATFAAAAVISVAQKPAATSSHSAPSIPMTLTPADILPQHSSKAEEATQGVLFKRVFTTEVASRFHYWTFGTSSNDMFKYDAKSGTLNIARNRALFNAQQQLDGAEVGIVRSTDNGNTWTFDVIIKTNETFFGMPTIGWVNPDDLSNPAEYPVSIFGFRYPIDRSVNPPRIGFDRLSMWNRTSGGVAEISLISQPRPGNGFYMDFVDVHSDNANGAVHAAGVLSTDPTAQYGTYGYFNFNLIVEDFGRLPTIPAQWAGDKWRPSPSLTGSFNAPIALSGDKDGTLYAVFNNITADNQDARTLEVSKSTDQGKTWSSLNVMPTNLLGQFAQATGGDIAFQPTTGTYNTPYDGGSLIVTGPEKFSYFYRLATGQTNPNDPTQDDTVLSFNVAEAKYDNGTWTLTRVAELNSYGFPMISVQDSISQAIGAPAIEVMGNGRGHELQSAITADGNNIVVKWVDINPDRPKQFNGVRVFDGPTNGLYTEVDTLTELFDTDIFITSRATNSNSWAAVKNVTDDDDMAFRTYMPDVVKSVDDVPLVRILGTGLGTITSLLPKAVAQLLYTAGASVDFGTTAVVSVDDNEQNYTFSMSSISPNPVSGAAQVSFTLDRAATVSVEVYDVLGALVGTYAPQQLPAGSHGMNVNASTFTAGTYNVALVVDGVRMMKPFVVVR